MHNQRWTLLFGLCLFPFFAFAHGEDVLYSLLIQLGSIFIFAIWLGSLKFKIAHKLILATSYFLTLSLVLFTTWNTPYRENKVLLNIAWTITPAFVCLTTYLFIKKRKKSFIQSK
jgi:RsiW-degrading membrane proteinase PrsW (M82 family)